MLNTSPSELILLIKTEFTASNQGTQTMGMRSLPIKDLLKLATDGTIQDKIDVCGLGVSSVLWVLCRESDPYIRMLVAKHTEVGILRILANDPSTDVRVEVAKHGIIEFLEILQFDKNFRVRKEVAKHYVPHILFNLVEDAKDSVKREVAKHPNSITLQLLLNDDRRYVAQEAADTLKRMKSL